MSGSLTPSHNDLVTSYQRHIGYIQSFQANHQSSSSERLDSEWLSDDGSLFRLLKRVKFSHEAFPLAVKSCLEWRRRNLPTTETNTAGPFFRTLPPSRKDRLGRPIVILDFSVVTGTTSIEQLKAPILQAFEELRSTLQRLNAKVPATKPVLQCTWLLSVEKVSMRVGAWLTELLPWMLREIQPNYHGICAAVCVVGSSWIESGLWAIVSKLLPQSILDKVIFPSRSELFQIIPPDSLPIEFGGTLTAEDLQWDGSDAETEIVQHAHSLPTPPPEPHSSTSPPATQERETAKRLARLSSQNPFFGYPTRAYNVHPESPPQIVDKRSVMDLILTLGLLYYLKYRRRLFMVAALGTLYVCLRLLSRTQRAGFFDWWKRRVFRSNT